MSFSDATSKNREGKSAAKRVSPVPLIMAAVMATIFSFFTDSSTSASPKTSV